MKFDSLTPESDILIEIGRRLSLLRKQQGFTQTQLAEEAGIGVATLRRIEGGQDSQMESWLKILKALNAIGSIDALLPEQLTSPMQQVRASKKGKKKTAPQSNVWGDEQDKDAESPP